ncbi:hypothetical protein C3486_00280 [Streptomyces sp. Ru73]|nr:hypothetical protein C3486_00280 [Streptomyces sp. Ru73]
MLSVRFPQDLIELQRARNHAYAELAGRSGNPTVLRRRLLRLCARLHWHPHFDGSDGRSPGARAELRRRVRENAGRDRGAS